MVVSRFARRAVALVLALVALLCASVFGLLVTMKLDSGSMIEISALLFYGALAAVFAIEATVLWRRPPTERLREALVKRDEDHANE